MKCLILLYLLFFLTDCKGATSDKVNAPTHTRFEKRPEGLKMDTLKGKLSNQLDSVTVEYWDNIDANTYVFKFSNDSKIVCIGDQVFTDAKNINSTDIVNRFVDYVNKFYIDKEEEIIFAKRKEPTIITDYPSITGIGYKNGKEVFSKPIQIGDESYEIEFNPIFIEIGRASCRERV